MWTCPKCGQELEDQFDQCWKCAGNKLTGTVKINQDAQIAPTRIAQQARLNLIQQLSSTDKKKTVNRSQIRNLLEYTKFRILFGAVTGFVLLLCLLTRPDNTSNILYYALFLVLWPVFAYLMVIGIDFLIKLYVGVMVGSGALAIIGSVGDNARLAVPAAAIAVSLLAIAVAAYLALAVAILGPGALAGFGIHHLLGGSDFAGVIGFITFLIVSFLISAIARYFVFPFGMGLFVGMMSGSIAREVCSAIFSVDQARIMSLDVERSLSRLRLDHLDFSSIGDAISSIIGLVERIFSVFYTGSWLIIVGAICLGAVFVYGALSEDDQE